MGGGGGARVGNSGLFSQASFVYVLCQMWLICGKCPKSNWPPPGWGCASGN